MVISSQQRRPDPIPDAAFIPFFGIAYGLCLALAMPAAAQSVTGLAPQIEDTPADLRQSYDCPGATAAVALAVAAVR